MTLRPVVLGRRTPGYHSGKDPDTGGVMTLRRSDSQRKVRLQEVIC